jgi:hypothetical protein
MIDPGVLYLVTYPGQPKGEIMLAIGVETGSWGVGFHDANRPRTIQGELKKETPNGFIWKRMGGSQQEKEFIFTVLSIEVYNKNVRPTVEGDPPAFNSADDLYEYYRRRFL